MKSESAFQFDYRGLALQNLRILVCQVCLDKPQPQLKPIIIGPDPIPVRDPRPGFAAWQMGSTAPVNVLELVDGDLFPPPPPAYGFYDNGGVLSLLPRASMDWPDYPPAKPGKLWSNGLVVTATFPLNTVANPKPIYWNKTVSDMLLAAGANVIRTTQPPYGSDEIWINPAMGGEVWVALPIPPPGGLFNNGGVLSLTPDGEFGWPLSDPGIPGALWSNAGVVTASLPVTTVASPQPIYWDQASSAVLLMNGANVIRTTQPANGSDEIWVNVAMGGEVWIAQPLFGTFSNDGGVLVLLPPGGYPSAPDGLPPGSVWSNGLAVSIIPGITPNPSAPPVYYGSITPVGLFSLGGGNLPTSPPTPGSLQLWNNGGLACVA